MAEAKLTVGIGVELEPGPVTREWLIGLGWVPPQQDSDEGVVTELDDEDDDWDPAEMMAVDVASLVPEARPLRDGGVYKGRAMGGAEAMRHRAAQLRRDLLSEVSSPERVDEMLRNLDVDVEALAAVDCDC